MWVEAKVCTQLGMTQLGAAESRVVWVLPSHCFLFFLDTLTFTFFFLIEQSFALIAQAEVQWLDLGSVQPPPLRFK